MKTAGNLAIKIDKKDLREKIIPIMEEALDQKFNEETIQLIVDRSPELARALVDVDKKQVIIGEVPDERMKNPKVTFSQYLGDIRRAAMKQVRNGSEAPEGTLKHLKPDQLVFADSNIPVERVPADIRKDLYEGTNSAGGYLVPTEESRELLNVAADNYSVVPGLCRQVPMRTHQITFPTLTSGLTAYWVPESTDTSGDTVDGDNQSGGEKYRSDIVLGQMVITAYVCAVKVVVSNQLLDDSDPQIDAILRALFAETLGDAWDTACLIGAGSTTDPITGIHGKVSTNALAAGATFNFDDVKRLCFAPLHQDAKSQVQIIGNTYAEEMMTGIKDNNDRYIYKSPGDDGKMPMIWGRPYHRNGNVPSNLGAQTDQTRLIAGDFKRHGFAGRRMGVIVKTNPWAEPYFSFNQTCFLAEFRVGFNVDHEKFFAELEGVPTA